MKIRLVLAVIAGAAVAAVGTLAAPASAADLGTLTLSQARGSVTDTPMFAQAVTSAPCPAGYGDAVLLRVGRPSGPFTNLRAPLQGGAYASAPVALDPNRSFAHALGGPTTSVRPGEGLWYVVAECFSTQKRHPDRFRTAIVVSGQTWSVADAAALAALAAPPVGASANVRIEVGVGSPTATGTTSSPGGGLPVTGTALTAVVLSGVILVGGGTGAVLLARRRRRGAGLRRRP